MSTLTEAQVAELQKPLDARHVSSRTQSGRKLSYVEGWHAIAEANRIFGFDGWTRETVEMREVRSPELVRSEAGKETWRVGFIAKVRVTVGGVVREGTGYGSGALPDLGEAYESAVKEAETDAMKRALMTFGNPFGLALYDKDRANVVDESRRPAPKAALPPPPDNAALDEQAIITDLVNQMQRVSTIVALEALRKDPGFVQAVKGLSKEGLNSVTLAGRKRREQLEGRLPKAPDLGDKLAASVAEARTTPDNLIMAG